MDSLEARSVSDGIRNVSDGIRTVSDEIRIIRAKSVGEDRALLIQAVTRAVLSVVVVATGAYLLITSTPVPDAAWQVALLVLGAYFGSEALHKFLSRNH